MSETRDNILLVDDKMDQAVNRLLDGISKSQGGMFNELLAIAKELELSGGDIKQSQKNLRLLRELRTRIQNQVLNDAYRNRAVQFNNQFDAVASLNNGYFKAIEAAFNPNRQVYRQVLRSAKDATFESLLGAGINEQVVEPVMNIVSDSITNGASWENMVDELRNFIKGTPETLGRLERYTKQISTDAINQFNANYNQSIANDLDLEWYLYSGGIRKTSRPFCKKYAGKWYHKKEVEDFGKGENLTGGKLCKGSFCSGRVKGTNSSNIFRYRGGYNCRHIFKPGGIDAVPESVIARNIKKGYYEPEGDEIEKPVIEKKVSKKQKTNKSIAENSINNIKTKADAENYLVKNGIAKVAKFGSAPNAAAVQITKEFDRLHNKYGQPGLNFIGSGSEYKKHFKTRAHSGRTAYAAYSKLHNSIYINPGTWKRSIQDAKRYKDTYQKTRTLESLQSAIQDRANTSLEVKKIIAEKNNRVFTVGERIEDTIAHEYGHAVHLRIERPRLNSILQFSRREGWSHVLSDYAGTNTKELFAESFAAFENPQIDNKFINPEIKKWIEMLKTQADFLKKTK